MFIIADKKIGSFVSFLILVTILATISVASAAFRFVRPHVNVPVRRGHGEKYKIVKFVKDGEQVKFIEEKGAWVKITTQGGAEGWMPKSYLSAEKPPAERIKVLQEENDQLKQDNSELNFNLTQLTTSQASTGEELAKCNRDSDKAEDERTASQEANRTIWFLTGAGVLFTGWLIGKFSSGSKKKRNRFS